MKTYKIFVHRGRHKAVKQGWSWPAFFFFSFWAMVKKMWILGIGLFVFFYFFFGFFLAAVFPENNQAVSMISVTVETVSSIVLGSQGNKLRDRNLVKRGYRVMAEEIEAYSPEAAVLLYVSQSQHKRAVMAGRGQAV